MSEPLEEKQLDELAAPCWSHDHPSFDYVSFARSVLHAALTQPAPQGVAEVMKFAHDLAGKKYNAGYQDSVKQGSGANLSYLGEDALAKLEQSITAIAQEHDALKARVAELEGDAARFVFLFSALINDKEEELLDLLEDAIADPKTLNDVRYAIDAAMAASKE